MIFRSGTKKRDLQSHADRVFEVLANSLPNRRRMPRSVFMRIGRDRLRDTIGGIPIIERRSVSESGRVQRSERTRETAAAGDIKFVDDVPARFQSVGLRQNVFR